MVEMLKDKYNIIRQIGQGGMAHIYLATEKNSDHKIAIKVLEPSSRTDEVKRKRFLHEINILKKVDSPYVAKMYDAEITSQYAYISMEFVDGHILKNYINKYSRLTADEAVEFAKQMALGFDEIHRSGIIHRDIKSQNIMVGNNGQIKIIDFGIALDDQTERLTKTNMLIGSPQYVSPELINQEEPTKQSDVYALGVLLYEMLSGEVPFSGKDAYDTLKKHQSAQMPRISKTFPNVPQSVENIITKATAKDITLRYSSMDEMYSDLKKSLDVSVQDEKPIQLTKQKLSFMRIINSKILIAVVISILLIIVVALIVIFSITEGV